VKGKGKGRRGVARRWARAPKVRTIILLIYMPKLLQLTFEFSNELWMVKKEKGEGGGLKMARGAAKVACGMKQPEYNQKMSVVAAVWANVAAVPAHVAASSEDFIAAQVAVGFFLHC